MGLLLRRGARDTQQIGDLIEADESNEPSAIGGEDSFPRVLLQTGEERVERLRHVDGISSHADLYATVGARHPCCSALRSSVLSVRHRTLARTSATFPIRQTVPRGVTPMPEQKHETRQR